MRIRHGALIINSVKVAHKGWYLCNSSSSLGTDFLEVTISKISKTYTLKCEITPSFTKKELLIFSFCQKKCKKNSQNFKKIKSV